jgi:acyl-CoA dehydrogenase
MDYQFSGQQQAIVGAAERICAKFPPKYWLERDRAGGFPEEFYTEVATAAWLGIAMPQAYGGAPLGITEAALFLRTVAAGGGAMAATSSIHLNIFGLQPVVLFGTEE